MLKEDYFSVFKTITVSPVYGPTVTVFMLTLSFNTEKIYGLCKRLSRDATQDKIQALYI